MSEPITLEDLVRQPQETDRLLRSLTEQTDRTVRAVEDLARRAAQNDDRWGNFADGLVAPACERLFASRGIPVHQVTRRSVSRQGDRSMEIDALVIDGDYVVAVEVKVNLRIDDVREHIARLADFRTFFPQYADRKVLGAVAGISIAEGVDRFAYREGLFVLAQSGDMVTILNDTDFKPKAW